MKRLIKLATILITISMIIIMILGSFNYSLARQVEEFNPMTHQEYEPPKKELTDIFSQAAKFLGIGMAEYKENADMKDNLDMIFSILVAVGTVLALIIGAILGIKFMMSSVEDKAKIKEALIPYIIGSVAIYGAFGIWKLVVSILNQIS